jgi:uncharacterized membrane protein
MSTLSYPPHKSSIGDIDANIIAFLAYLIIILIGRIDFLKYIGWIIPLIIYIIEKNSGLVKFHAMQSFVLNLSGTILNFILSEVIGRIFSVSQYHNLSKIGAFFTFGISGIMSIIIGLLSFGIYVAVLIFSIISIVNAYNYKEYEIPFIYKISEKVKEYIK